MKVRRFVAIDGESYTDENDHRYVLLAASNGEYTYNPNGLPTATCFDFLLTQRAKQSNYLFVAFGLNYDVNMMLRDIPKPALQHLWDKGSLDWGPYRLAWVPGKHFSVKTSNRKAVRIYDVFGFFQCSFVNALKRWNIPLPDDIEEMKQSRSIFSDEMRDKMIDYCIGECQSLVALMDAMRDALRDVDLMPSSWVGAGSIAAAMLNRHGIRDFHRYDDDFPAPVHDGIMRSYFGGRVELFQQGYFPRLTDYDVCSAYPSECLSLPPMLGGTWNHASDFLPGERHSIWRVEWDVDPDEIVMPFPYRQKGNIYYPSRGHGWYHYPEIETALRAYPENITVHEGWTFKPLGNHEPFAFIQDVYDERAKLKVVKHPGEKVLKLGLNSLYGKLAQGVGFNNKLPPFQSFYWAGRITSGTRARLFELAKAAPEQLVMIATDGIFFADPPPQFPVSNRLGGLDVTTFTDCFVAQPGVYCGTDPDGERFARSRGFFAREINFDALRDVWDTDGPYGETVYPSRRFVGLGSALHRNDFTVWRTWNESTRRLSLYPNRKFLREWEIGTPIRHHPGRMDDYRLSDVYTPKGAITSTELLDLVEGTEQPMREDI